MSISVVFFLASLAVHAHTKELATKRTTTLQDSKDQVVDRLVDRLVNRASTVSPLHNIDLEDTMLGKSAAPKLSIEASITPANALSTQQQIDERIPTLDQLAYEQRPVTDVLGQRNEDEDSIIEIMKLLGGAKKRKKKVYKTPKRKAKVKVKRPKFYALKFYEVKGDELVRTRKKCPECGETSGSFLGRRGKPDEDETADNLPRYECGKCGHKIYDVPPKEKLFNRYQHTRARSAKAAAEASPIESKDIP